MNDKATSGPSVFKAIGIIMVSLVVLVVAFVLVFGCMWMSYTNGEARLRNAITAKQADNHSQLDNTLKVITQNAQVTQAQTAMLKDIIVGNADARKGGSGSLVTAIHEAVPNMDQSTGTFRQLMNTITAARNGWTENQRQLLDLKREDDNYFNTQPASFFVSTLAGRSPVSVQIVTSDRAETAFVRGTDNDTNVFAAGK